MELSLYVTFLLLLVPVAFGNSEKNENCQDPVLHKKFTDGNLQRMMKELRGANMSCLKILEIENIKEEALPRNFFEDINISQLIFRNTNMQTPGPTPFEGLTESLESIAFINNIEGQNMKGWNWNELSGLKKLNTIVISRCHMTVLNKTFSDMKDVDLKRLFLSANTLKGVEDNSLDSFSNLEEISFENCELSKIPRKMFPASANKLFRINLSSNHIYVLERNSFKGMIALKHVDLEKNNLMAYKYPHECTFADMALHYLGLYGNDRDGIECYFGLEWLIKDNYKLNNSSPYYEDGSRELLCSNPKRFYGVSVKLLEVEEPLPVTPIADHHKFLPAIFHFSPITRTCSFQAKNNNKNVF